MPASALFDLATEFGAGGAAQAHTDLQVDLAQHERRQGPSIRVFGRLAPGASLDQAQTELTAIGQRAAADFPATNRQLRPRVLPYTDSFFNDEIRWQTYLMQSIFVMLLVVACANVATLVYARTATRQTEIVVRSALGASRGRILVQPFIEALVLASVAAGVGLIAADWTVDGAMDLFWSVQSQARPFWWNNSLSPATVLYVAVLTVLGSASSRRGLLPLWLPSWLRSPCSFRSLASTR